MTRYHDDDRIPTLEFALGERMRSDDLKKLAALTKAKLSTRKADLAAVIVKHLEGDRLRTVWQCLDDLQRAAVAEVVHGSSARFLADRFHAKYGRNPNWGPTDSSGYHRTPSPLGFFFYGDCVMPDDLRERLKAFVPPPVEGKIRTLPELPATYGVPFSRWNPKTKSEVKGINDVVISVHERERSAQRELVSVLRLVDAGKIAVSDKTRKASAAAMDKVTAVLDGGDYYPRVPVTNKWDDKNAGPIRAFAWPLLVQAGTLVQLSGSKLQLTKAGRTALAAPAAETIRTIWTKWVDITLLDELSRIDCVKGQTGKGKHGLTAVSSRRDAISCALAECPVGVWVSTDEFARFMRASDNDFSVTRNAWNLYIGELQYGSLGYDENAHILDSRYLSCLLLEYAATLGLIDVAIIPPAGARHDYHELWGTDNLPFFSRYDGLMYFRLTSLGAYTLDVETDYVPASVDRKSVLRVLPNLEVAAIGSKLDQGDRLALDAFATQVSDLVWRLDSGKLLAAVEEGRPADELRSFLEARSDDSLPDTVARLIEDVADRSTKVHDRGLARLIECAEPSLAALIANDTRTRKHCLRAGERHLVVAAASEAAFKRTLREVGYLLAVEAPRPSTIRRANSSGDPTVKAAGV